MQKLPLIGGSYSARSVIANCQKCWNLYPEPNRGDAPVPVTHYQRPGLVPLATPTPGRGRGIYQASNGTGYMVVGTTLYLIGTDWTLYNLGSIAHTYSSNNPVSMVDNGTTLVIVDGRAGAGNANGSFHFTTNPSAGDTFTTNGTVWTFVSGVSSGNNIHIESTLALTMVSVQAILRASTDPAVDIGIYNIVADGGTGYYLYVTTTVPGPLGMLYTLAASAATVSGANLTLNGSPVSPVSGWTCSLGTLSSSQVGTITDVSWTGADRIDYIDTFLIWNSPGTDQFWSSTSNTAVTPIDSTYVAAKTGYPDPLQSIIVNRHEILLPGLLKSEVWYDAGNPQFPFAQITGTYIEHGLAAKYSLASADLNVYWLSRDLQGQGVVLRKTGYDVKRISNFALEYQIRLMYATGVDISDAVGYTYQIDGHLFYVLSFPSGNQTWVWDESVGDPDLGWSQRGWTDTNGQFNRDRGVLGAAIYGKNVVLDWETGVLYEQKMDSYVDTVGGQDYPITYLRTFPHLLAGTDPKTGAPTLAEGCMVQHSRFMLNAECGTGPAGQEPKFTLRWSDDRGKTWGEAVLQSAGRQGEYETRPEWSGIGQAMDRVYEVSWTFPGQVALNGAWVDGIVGPR